MMERSRVDLFVPAVTLFSLGMMLPSAFRVAEGWVAWGLVALVVAMALVNIKTLQKRLQLDRQFAHDLGAVHGMMHLIVHETDRRDRGDMTLEQLESQKQSKVDLWWVHRSISASDIDSDGICSAYDPQADKW